MFQKGVSGNPAGRPKKGNTIKDLMEEVMNQKRMLKQKDGTEKEVRVEDMLMQRWVEFAMTDYPALIKMMEFRHGKPDVFKHVEMSGGLKLPKIILTSEIEEENDDYDDELDKEDTNDI